jgi:zinc protease
MRRLVTIILSSLAFLFCTLPGTRVGPTPQAKEGALRTTLNNGLKVVLVEDHSAPVVALNVWVRTGSADELPGEFGMAHVFEHMLFKGTERRAVGEIARTVEAAGGNINAFTSFDMTVYHITMASRDAAVGVDVLADAVQHSTFDPDELARELEVVIEEIRRGEDSPGRVLSQNLFATAFRTHPYGRPVIGTEESVRSFTREGILEFHRRWYVTNNMTFVVVGDFDTDAMLEQIRQVFAEAQPSPDLAHPRASEPPQAEARVRVIRRPFQQPMLGVVYPITRFEDDDTAYLDLLSMVLGSGDSSRLYRNVKDRQRLVHTVSAHSYTPLDPGLLMIDASLEGDQIEPALAAIRDEIDRLTAFGPSEIELERARVNLLSHEVREKETMQGQARKYGYYETLADGIELEEQYLERVRRATPEDLQRVAEKYLVPEHVTVGLLLPEELRPELDEAALLAELERKDSGRDAAQGTDLGEGIFRYVLPNGLRVVVKPNKTVPLVSLRLAFLGGQLAENEDTQGINAFLAAMLERGTEQRSAAQFAAEVEGIAANIDGFSGRNSFGLTAEFLKESLDTGLELFADALLHPAFDPDEIQKVRADTLAALERREDSLAHKAFDLMAQGLHPGHPYRFVTMGTEESVQKIDAAALRSFFETYAQPSNGVLGLVGDVDPDAVVAAIALHLSDWSDTAKVALPDRTLPEAPTEPRQLSLEKNKQQVHIVLGFPGVALTDPDLPALDVLTQLLAGQGGRLFLELRDRRSLAYSVTAFSIEGLDPGSFGLYIASAPEKLEESIAGLRGELEKILNDPIEEAEIERARAYLIGSHAVSLQRFATQASLMSLDELYGMEATHHLGYGGRIEAVTQEDVKRVARRIIDLDAPLLAIVK